ncbi:dephospho-CoA kinase [Confluentibacter flavum]|uniref:Dephospho-CoA kinase n=1 Tax=Confluentibacter flavum TaxID=1909700 RepID=A0A2N3HJ04_9FLAO|nr:dephospho-CoA kinase [Confluentibacter flavum]PKQ44874.1 dephospho-CoA kinase [Confluentibacter flavum]
MIIVGLTGGIGSGKTTVAKEFQALGVPIYIADEEAKKLMNTSKVLKRQLTNLFGEQAYVDNELNRPFIADIIFKNESYLQKMNAIVHPKVGMHFKKWASKQRTDYVIKEAAILFENNGYKQCDFVITVTAPKNIRIERLLKRESTTKEKIEAVMNNQWPDDAKVKLSHFVIDNITIENTKEQVLKIHHEILKHCGKS